MSPPSLIHCLSLTAPPEVGSILIFSALHNAPFAITALIDIAAHHIPRGPRRGAAPGNAAVCTARALTIAFYSTFIGELSDSGIGGFMNRMTES